MAELCKHLLAHVAVTLTQLVLAGVGYHPSVSQVGLGSVPSELSGRVLRQAGHPVLNIFLGLRSRWAVWAYLKWIRGGGLPRLPERSSLSVLTTPLPFSSSLRLGLGSGQEAKSHWHMSPGELLCVWHFVRHCREWRQRKLLRRQMRETKGSFGYKRGLWNQTVLGSRPDSYLLSGMTLGKLFNLSFAQFPHM